MTTIYQIANPAASTTNYVCDSQATADAGQADSITGIFSVGTSADADALLATNRTAWILTKIDIFTVVKGTPNGDGTYAWSAVNLATESDNTDTVYQLLNVPHGDHVRVAGLAAARAQLETIQTNYVVFCGLDQYQTLTKWPAILPVPPSTPA